MKIRKVLDGPKLCQVLNIKNYLNSWTPKSEILALLRISRIIKQVHLPPTNHPSHLTFLNLSYVFYKMENINLLLRTHLKIIYGTISTCVQMQL